MNLRFWRRRKPRRGTITLTINADATAMQAQLQRIIEQIETASR